ncbi:MAG: Mut7-C ubiquitin/RNAse domain-containing protein [Spirochaetales bacterium]|nr:Mut7-C ubiquitin/RNAse domain-containing protein [Spirochaetales bacterium]
MLNVRIRFYEELNFFLEKSKRKREIQVSCKKGTTIKAIIEAFGVPHTEVDLVLVNGESMSFSYQLKDRDRLSVYPVFESFDITTVSLVRPIPLRITRFILDVHLGKLAKFLRLLGFDTRYSNSFSDREISREAYREKRIILTRDKGLLKRKIVTHGYYIKSRNSREQLFEVVKRFDLLRSLKPFTRCIRCNEQLIIIEEKEIIDSLPDEIRKRYDSFHFCSVCNKVYWKGSHWENMKRILDEIYIDVKKDE